MSQVVIADGHPVTRHAVRTLLEKEGHQVAGEAENGADALQLCLENHVDLLILDFDLSRLSGLEVMRRLQARGAKVPVLAFSSQVSEDIVRRFLQAGASGFVSKQVDMSELSLAIAVVLRGRSYFPAHLLSSVNASETLADERELLSRLSNREVSVLYFLASGLTNQQIANELTLSEKTVSTYRSRLQQKLNLRSLPELIDFARRNAIVAAPESQAATPSIAVDDFALLQNMINTLPDPLYVRDTAGRLVYANSAFLHLYDTDLSRVKGTRVLDVDWLPPSQAELLHNFFLQAIAAERPFTRDIEVTIHGRRHILHHWGSPYRDNNGRMLGMICGSTDITERHDRLRSLREEKDRAETNNLQKLNFLVRLSKEFTVPLGNILALLDSIRARGQVNTNNTSDLKAIATLSSDLKELVEDLEVIAQMESGERRPQLQSLRINEIAEAACLAAQQRAKDKELSLITQLDTPTSPPVLGDPVLIREIIDYLLAYILRETNSGSVFFALHSDIAGETTAIRIKVSAPPSHDIDSMEVYSLEELAADASHYLVHDAPVGLIVAKRLVMLLHGDMIIATPPERGTTVSVHLSLPTLLK
ncbi:response regulator [Pseudomonas sp. BBP2017]|uniref:response regulator n=1 Tax=Pseudomonas sp. BBP2017 TaxID=2109731 RepID=UPI000D13C6F6|nr:response regulator [Pseudomonas sp. BBP2017]PSS56325.1 hypothetical protein C6382_14650 [Pseudomonas sp. BBP2017]